MGRIVVAAVGNVQHSEIVTLIENNFDSLPAQVPLKRTSPASTPHSKTHKYNCAQTHICLSTLAYSYSNPKKFPLLVLDTVLGAGMGSRLFQNIREKHGVAYNIYSYVDFYSDTGLFGVYIGSDPADTEKCLELINAEFDALRKKPLSVNELEKVKTQLKGNFVLGLESTSMRMHRIAKMELYLQKFLGFDEIIKQIETVTQDEVFDVASELLREENLHITQLQPENNK
jgi:predicted Zn-dependent peptidase